MKTLPQNIVISLALLHMPSDALAFDCAKAFLPVDFVICSDAEVLKANEAHEKSWYDTRSRLTDEQKKDLLTDQRRWLKEFPPTCGVPARGKPLPTVPKSVQICVTKALVARARFLDQYQNPTAGLPNSPPVETTTAATTTQQSTSTNTDTAATAATKSDGQVSVEARPEWPLPKTLSQESLASLQNILPISFKNEEWIYQLEGVRSPLIDLTVQGKAYIAGQVCKPKDCQDNNFAFLVASDGSRAVGSISVKGQITAFGQQDPGESALLGRWLRLAYRGEMTGPVDQETAVAQRIISSNGTTKEDIRGLRIGMNWQEAAAVIKTLNCEIEGLQSPTFVECVNILAIENPYFFKNMWKIEFNNKGNGYFVESHQVVSGMKYEEFLKHVWQLFHLSRSNIIDCRRVDGDAMSIRYYIQLTSIPTCYKLDNPDTVLITYSFRIQENRIPDEMFQLNLYNAKVRQGVPDEYTRPSDKPRL